jgi:hypothetical protein
MAENPFTQATHPPAPDYARIAQSDPQIISGARWFWWIAGLSVVNTIMLHSGSDVSFVVGLGFTLLADVIFREYQIVAFAIDAVALGFFFGIGWFAGKGRFWAFVVGMVAYTLDAGIYLLFQDWMSLAFHGLALFGLFRGAKQLRLAVKAATEAPLPPPISAPVAPAS